ncbi:MAG: ral secretion pathway protein [Chthoniobacter sp.]|jgi:general secretion pathway protein D|nr:ral secretion pathway protein [Chthoniobacter sp.]
MIKPPLATTISSVLVGSMLLLPTLSFAADGGFRGQTAAERELPRRYDYLRRGQQAMEAGDKAMADRDYAQAVVYYNQAVDNIPNAENSRREYRRALDKFSEASVKLAEQRITEGRYEDATNTLKLVLDDRYNPKYKDAIVILARLETPDYYNKTITPGHRGKVEQVKQFFVDAEGFYQSGRYDLALKRTEQILNLDPYNIAARKFQEKVNKAIDDYAVVSYDETRSNMVRRVDQAWARPIRRFNLEASRPIETRGGEVSRTEMIQKKLERIVIPRLEFKEATIREAIEFLKKKSVELDTTEANPANRGVNLVLKLEGASGGGAGAAPDLGAPAAAPAIPGLEALPGAAAPGAPGAAPAAFGSPADARITVSLTNIPLSEALRYVTNLAGLKYKVEPFAVSIVPASTNIDVLITKEYKVRPDLIGRGAGGGEVGGGLAAPAAGGGAPADATRGGTGIAEREKAKDWLIAQGVAFGPQASAIYLPTSSKLIVRNTQEQLDLVETIISSVESGNGTIQIEIEAKFVEISQNNLKELSFDWQLGAANVPGSNRIFGSGGTAGTAPTPNGADFPFFNQGAGAPVGGNPVTAGNRSGQLAISQNAIDALLFGIAGNSMLGPGIAALSGVFTDPQFQLVIRALNQKKGVDLLSAPRVTTKPGQRAVIEIIREFRYPTEFDPPQIPQNFGGQGTNGGGGAGVTINLPQSFPVTPTTPTAFETRNTGVTLEVEPNVGPDGYTIDLNLVPQVVEFEGFINYGSPISSSSINILTGQPLTLILTPNVINQPIFSTRKITTSVSVFDGQTVVLGGLMREDVQKVEDKVPLLGDIPLLGRLFRSSVDQHIKRNLVIFVSARLINPAGDPIRPNEEIEEIVETLPAPEILPLESNLPLMQK